MSEVMSSYRALHPSVEASRPTHTPQIHTTYLRDLLDPERRDRAVRICIAALKRSMVEFDAIAFTGMSGALIAPVIAYELDKPVILVRKPGDKAHSPMRVEGDAVALTYVIVDDFVSSGSTLRSIIEAITAWRGEFFDPGTEQYVSVGNIPRKCVGVVTVRDEPYNPGYAYQGTSGVMHVRNLNYRGE